jgi:hypothetical protein
VLIAESKLDAQLTLIRRELRYLDDLHEGGLLLFIVPDRRRDEFRDLIMTAAKPAAGPNATCTDLNNWVQWQEADDRKTLAVAGWGAVIASLEKGISGGEPVVPQHAQLMQELDDLRWFCSRKTAMTEYNPLAPIEIGRHETAQFVMSVMALIKLAVDKAWDLRILDSRPDIYDDNGLSYGYHISFGRDRKGEPLGAWFGLYFKAWARSGKSPIWLQFWDETAQLVDPVLTAFGAVSPEHEKEWLGSIRPESGAKELEAVNGVVDHLAKVKAALCESGTVVHQPAIQ